MKKILLLILSLFIAFCTVVSASAVSANNVTVTLDGKKIDCESYGSPATIVEGRTLVPLRAIFEALGASVEWDQNSKTVTSNLDGTQINLTVGQNILYKNGSAITLDVPASIINSRTTEQHFPYSFQICRRNR